MSIVALELCDPADWVLEIPPVSEFPNFNDSMRQVKRAGDVIAGNLVWTPENEQTICEAFRIANNWRDAHAYPMNSMRRQLIYYLGFELIAGLTAARLKRMQAIRRK